MGKIRSTDLSFTFVEYCRCCAVKFEKAIYFLRSLMLSSKVVAIDNLPWKAEMCVHLYDLLIFEISLGSEVPSKSLKWPMSRLRHTLWRSKNFKFVVFFVIHLELEDRIKFLSQTLNSSMREREVHMWNFVQVACEQQTTNTLALFPSVPKQTRFLNTQKLHYCKFHCHDSRLVRRHKPSLFLHTHSSQMISGDSLTFIYN